VPTELWEQPTGDAGLTLAAELTPKLAAEMAAAVFDARPSLARALYVGCLQAGLDGDEETDLAATVDRLASSETERVGVLRADETLAVVGRLDVATAAAKLAEIEARTTSPTVAREARAYRAAVLVLSTHDITTGAALAEQVVDDAEADVLLRASAALTCVTAVMESGRSDDALVALDELPSRIGRVDDPIAFGMQILARTVTLGVAGRLEEATKLADAAVDLCVGLGDHGAAGAFLTARSSLALEAGRVVDARVDADAALQQLLELEQFDMQRLAASLGARACASLGDAAGAATFLERVDAVMPLRFLSRAEEVRARVWHAAAAGRTEAAVAHLEAGLGWLESHGQRSRLLLVLHDFVRLDLADLARDRIVGVAPQVQSAYADPIREQAEGLADRDPARVAAAAVRFGELGTVLWEAEAWAQAARLHERQRARTRSVRALEAARRAMARCQGARTPALAGVVDAAVGLSRREREVSALAATGVADKEIARRLGVSVRTVETHLSSAYAKLGVDGRFGLNEVFGSDGPITG
jgi:DNA-binding CsgD family transcriptional regulator